LIAQLWDSLDDDQLPLTGSQQEELERRLTSLDQDRKNGVTWSALKAELEQRLPKAFTVVFTQAARAELIEAQDWY
jgi:putative addiction module component (TIGR02574 family)